MIDVGIRDGNGEGNRASIDKYGAIASYDSIPEVKQFGEHNRYQFLREKLSSMNVNGSITPVEFTLDSSRDYDIYLTKLILVIGDTKVKEDKYGDITALTVGIDLIVTESGIKNYIIRKGKYYGELSYQVGTAVGDPKIKSTTGEVGTIVVDLSLIIPRGIRLGRSSLDSLTFVVNDDLTGLVDHELYCIGYKHVD